MVVGGFTGEAEKDEASASLDAPQVRRSLSTPMPLHGCQDKTFILIQLPVARQQP